MIYPTKKNTYNVIVKVTVAKTLSIAFNWQMSNPMGEYLLMCYSCLVVKLLLFSFLFSNSISTLMDHLIAKLFSWMSSAAFIVLSIFLLFKAPQESGDVLLCFFTKVYNFHFLWNYVKCQNVWTCLYFFTISSNGYSFVV